MAVSDDCAACAEQLPEGVYTFNNFRFCSGDCAAYYLAERLNNMRRELVPLVGEQRAAMVRVERIIERLSHVAGLEDAHNVAVDVSTGLQDVCNMLTRVCQGA